MADDPSPDRPVILVVDDDSGLRRILEVMLAREGYGVVQARDGEAALALARSRRLGLIVVDLAMPRMRGDAFCRAYREHGGTAPIVLLTATNVDHETIAYYGADGYIAKPFRVREVLDVVVRLAGSADGP